MVRPLVAAGTITSVQNDFVTDANADWTDGQFNGSNGAFYAEFSSGLIASIAETDGTTHKLKLSANVQDSGPLEIKPCMLLAASRGGQVSSTGVF